MALLDEILAWCETDLKPWQSDAVRRLFQNVELDDADFDELLVMLKASRGIPFEDVTAPQPLTRAHLPTSAPDGEPIVLEALHSLKNVNRLADGQRLDFLPNGLTVVFGENGAGKSGYSRVIKSACRARVKDEPVLPDARQHKRSSSIPEAIFVVKRNGESQNIFWRAADVPADLASVAVLDTRCARAYTNEEGELIFAPWGLDVVENLARLVYPRLTQAIRHEQEQLTTSDAAFADLKADKSSVATFLNSLSHQTTDEAARLIATFTEDDATKLATVESALSEKSPVERVHELRELATRLQTVAETLDELQSRVSDEKVDELEELDGDLRAAIDAEVLAASALRAEEELLEGTGQGPWRVLFTSAQAFVAAHDHAASEGSPCPLCQTRLDVQAAARMERFAAYISDDASKRAASQRELHENAFRALSSLTMTAVLDQGTVDQIEAHEPGWTSRKEQFVRSLQTRRDWVAKAGTETHDWTARPALLASPAEVVRHMRASILERAETLTRAMDDAARDALRAEAVDLKAKSSLSHRLPALLDLIEAKRTHYALGLCMADLNTRPISDKAGALASSTVTRQLSAALNAEFDELGVAHLHTSLVARIERGKAKVKLRLDLPGAQKPELVLSEGERRVIAIGSFFAELQISGHRGAAVFDDPVSSLDHQRRQHVARRLVKEAANRQVVIFTHDTVFLAELMVELKRTKVAHAFRYLSFTQNAAGFIEDGLPWHHQRTRERIDRLEQQVREFAREEPDLTVEEKESRARSIYSRLRQVIERGVEEVVFCGVLQRYNDYVRVPGIIETIGLTSDECRPIVLLYERVSDVIEGHDKALARAYSVPTAAAAAAAVNELRRALQAIRDRRHLAKVA